MSRSFQCPSCEWARRRGELRQLTTDGCPICDPGTPDEIINEIASNIETIDADETDRKLLTVALGDLIAALP
jgi:hypothetical protein